MAKVAGIVHHPLRPRMVDDVELDALAASLADASPKQILAQALDGFGDDVAVSLSGAEDVLLLEYVHQLGRSHELRVFTIDTGRLHPETHRLFDAVETRYGVRVECVFPEAADVESLVRRKGFFSFYRDGHAECCGVRKVEPLRRKLATLRAWITGQRRDQSPGTRAALPVVQEDDAFTGQGGARLVKWNPFARVRSHEIWDAIRTHDVPYNRLHERGYVSIGCEPCTRPILPGQHEREGRWWWEQAEHKECGIHRDPTDR